MAKGDHIIVPLCGPFTHHGIDIGYGTVVHWSSGIPGKKHPFNKPGRKSESEIRRTPIEEFGDLTQLKVREYGTCFDSETVVQRALDRIGEDGYSVVGNNCEHFATRCKTDKHQSKQVRDVSATVIGASIVSVVRIVSAAGPVPGLCSRGTIAGLGAIGGGPATGLVLAVTAPTVVSVLVVRAIFNDDEALPEAERGARCAGRAASVGGAVLGSAGSVGVVAAAGVPGLSAVGISTGLAAIGGGSVAFGLIATIAFPVVLTLGAGWLVHRLQLRYTLPGQQ